MASTALLLMLASSLAAVGPPMAGPPSGPEDCETIQLYFYEGFEAEGYFDFANWTTADRRTSYLGLQPEHWLTMTPGVIEFYVEVYGPHGRTGWQLAEWGYVPSCSRAAIYLKQVGGQPVLRLRVFPPAGA
jgi:hypothetical protein